MEVKIKLEKDTDNKNLYNAEENISFKVYPRLTIITLENPYREVSIQTEDFFRLCAMNGQR